MLERVWRKETPVHCWECKLVQSLWRTIWVKWSCSVMSDSLWPPWIAVLQSSLSITSSRSLLKLMSIESLIPSNHLILCHPLLLLPSIIPSIRVFSSESVLPIRWPKYWSFSFSISPSNEESSPTPHFKSINSSVLSFLYSPTLTAMHDYWKNHNLD